MCLYTNRACSVARRLTSDVSIFSTNWNRQVDPKSKANGLLDAFLEINLS